jgi:hypothetical protein
MSAGAVLAATGKRKCSELGGLFHSMPLTTICGTIGALAISSFPFTSGFISKSMVTQAAVDGHLQMVWLFLSAASAGVFLHAGIKFPWFVFFQKDSGLRPPDPPASMRWAMVIFAALCIGLGVWPDPLYAMLPYAVNYVPYTAAHVLTQLQLLLFSGLAFFVMLELPQTHTDHHPGRGLVLAQRRALADPLRWCWHPWSDDAACSLPGWCQNPHQRQLAASATARRVAAAVLAYRQHVLVGDADAAGQPAAVLPLIKSLTGCPLPVQQTECA